MRHLTYLIIIYISCSLFLQGQAGGVYNPEKIEQEMLELVNKARSERGTRPLRFHPVLNDMALGHSQKMAAEGQLSHRFPNYKTLQERLMDAGLAFIKSGENVAFSEDPEAKFIHDGFMNSPGHRQNILDPDFTHCGIRIVCSNKKFYVTEEFAQVYTLLKAEEVEALLEQDAAARYRRVFGVPLVFYSQLKPYARHASKLSARDEKLEPYLSALPDQWGGIQAISVVSPDPEKIKTALAKEIEARRYSGAAIGVSRITNAAFPGGAYSVSILFVEGLQADWTPEKFKQVFLAELNRVRKGNGLGLLTLDKRFTGESFPVPATDAVAWEKKHREQLNAFYNKTVKGKVEIRIFNYTSYDPREIPARLLDILGKGSGCLDKIGILVHRPVDVAGAAEGNVPANYFMVTLIFPEL
ncbi:MAG: CAP domain-containing protein [Candidatus Aminicenantes bacterium]|nr:CAP domain-containing protein [Candidatus Aminicenantes bacterium]